MCVISRCLDTTPLNEAIYQLICRRQMPNYSFEITFRSDESLTTKLKTFHRKTMTHARKISQFSEIFIDTCAFKVNWTQQHTFLSKQGIITPGNVECFLNILRSQLIKV